MGNPTPNPNPNPNPTPDERSHSGRRRWPPPLPCRGSIEEAKRGGDVKGFELSLKKGSERDNSCSYCDLCLLLHRRFTFICRKHDNVIDNLCERKNIDRPVPYAYVCMHIPRRGRQLGMACAAPVCLTFISMSAREQLPGGVGFPRGRRRWPDAERYCERSPTSRKKSDLAT